MGRAWSQSPHSWLGPANTYAQDPYAPWNGSSESINTHSSAATSSVSSAIQQARANSLTKARLAIHDSQNRSRSSQGHHKAPTDVSSSSASRANFETEYYGVPSFRQQQQLHHQQQMLQQQQQQPGVIHLSRFKSQPGSPDKDPSDNNKSYSSLPYQHRTASSSTTQDARGSTTSLTSSSNNDDAEMRRLRLELAEEQERVLSLTSQLATNSHVVAAFEQSLSNMTNRLAQLTSTSERKDAELAELRRTIDKVRQSGVDAGLVKATSVPPELGRQTSADSMASDVSCSEDEDGSVSQGKSKKKGHKRSGWLRNSLTKAFVKGDKGGGGGGKHIAAGYAQYRPGRSGSVSDAENEQSAIPQTPEPHRRSASAASGAVVLQDGGGNEELLDPRVVSELRRQLVEKDTLLTETRLQALSSAHQLESLRETVSKMRSELMTLKSNNEKKDEVETTKKVNGRDSVGSVSSLNTSSTNDKAANDDNRLSVAVSESSVLSGPSSLDLSASTDPTGRDGGKLVTVTAAAFGGQEEEVVLGTVAVSGKSKWDLLDSLVHRYCKGSFTLRDSTM